MQIALVQDGFVQKFRGGNQELADSLNSMIADSTEKCWHPVSEIVFCVDCGQIGECIGHMSCQFPQNHP